MERLVFSQRLQGGLVAVIYQNANWARVSIADFPAFELETRKIHPSKNGRTYFCRRDLTRRPDTENTRCIFVGSPDYVREQKLKNRRPHF